VARRLAERGFRLALTYLAPDEADEIEEVLPITAADLLLQRVDVSDPEAVNTLMETVVARFGPINVVTALVGGWTGGKDVPETSDVRFERMIDLNLRTAFYTARAAIPHMRPADWGRIVFVGSRSALEPPAGQAAYNAAKAGVIALARSIAQEVGEDGITANVVVPSFIDTPAFREAVAFADFVNWPTPGDIAEVIGFLASPESGAINGAMVPVYGQA
jgi:NAD(P)-dependent dehydrogenase (short-subunit alcohol dehydrogenase family)